MIESHGNNAKLCFAIHTHSLCARKRDTSVVHKSFDKKTKIVDKFYKIRYYNGAMIIRAPKTAGKKRDKERGSHGKENRRNVG